jgi:GNAT superfamily N-acetyltransferase
MAIELRLCEPVHVPALLATLGAWHRQAREAFRDEAATGALLGLTRNPSLGSAWLIEHRGRAIGYAVIEARPARGFLWQEAELTALYLVPEMRMLGVGRMFRRVLRELLLGRGYAMTADDIQCEDRFWARLGSTQPASLRSDVAA